MTVKDFVNRFQKDVKDFQKSIQFESDELVKKIKTMTAKSNLDQTRKTVERVVKKKVREFEPAILKFVSDLKKSAAKAGIDLNDFETRMQRVTKKARETILKKTTTTRGVKPKKASPSAGTKKASAAKKTTAKASAKAPAKKAKTSKKSSAAN